MPDTSVQIIVKNVSTDSWIFLAIWTVRVNWQIEIGPNQLPKTSLSHANWPYPILSIKLSYCPSSPPVIFIAFTEHVAQSVTEVWLALFFERSERDQDKWIGSTLPLTVSSGVLGRWVFHIFVEKMNGVGLRKTSKRKRWIFEREKW